LSAFIDFIKTFHYFQTKIFKPKIMKTKKILIRIIGILVVIILIGFLFPSEITLQKSITIDAPVEIVFDQVTDLHQWKYWSPWHQMDTTMETNYSGPYKGEGSIYEWSSQSEKVGSGTMKIVNSSPHDSIHINLNFMDKGTAFTTLYFSQASQGTEITWTFKREVGKSPFSRYFGLLMKSAINKNYSDGLAQLKAHVEMLPDKFIRVEKLSEISYIGIRTTSNNKEIGITMGRLYTRMMSYIQENSIETTGPPIAVYYSFTDSTMDYEAGIPVTLVKDIPEPMKIKTIEAGQFIIGDHIGPYEGMQETYNAMMNYQQIKKIDVEFKSIEKYITDPEEEDNPSKWLTRILFPVNSY